MWITSGHNLSLSLKSMPWISFRRANFGATFSAVCSLVYQCYLIVTRRWILTKLTTKGAVLYKRWEIHHILDVAWFNSVSCRRNCLKSIFEEIVFIQHCHIFYSILDNLLCLSIERNLSLFLDIHIFIQISSGTFSSDILYIAYENYKLSIFGQFITKGYASGNSFCRCNITRSMDGLLPVFE